MAQVTSTTQQTGTPEPASTQQPRTPKVSNGTDRDWFHAWGGVESSPETEQSYFQKWGSEWAEFDAAATAKRFAQPVINRAASALTGANLRGFDEVYDRLLMQESRKRHLDDSGKLTTNKKSGARGISQVMPATGQRPGYGVAPLRDDSEGEYVRFGRDLLKAYVNEFDGDMAKGLAAYNWGPGNVKRAVRKHGDNWIDNLPAETSTYVSNILGTHDYGNRVDGTKKSTGFLGELKNPDGSVSTEISIGVEFDDFAGEIPTLTPNMPKRLVKYLQEGGEVTDEIADIAIEHARKRLAQGKSVFWNEKEDGKRNK